MKESSTESLIAVFLIALLVSGVFSLIETAILTFSRSRMKHLHEQGEASASLLLGMTEKIDKLLATILLCNNLANVVAATVATILMVRWIGEEEYVLVISSFLVTAMILIFSEITPKAIGVRHSEKASLRLAKPLNLVMRILAPVVFIVEWVVRFVLKMTGNVADSPFKGSIFGFPELRSVVKDTQNLGGADETHRDMLVNVIDIKDMSVEDIMVPKKDILAIDVNSPPGDIVNELKRTYFTKIPIYRDKPDNIIGFISTQEILALALNKAEINQITLMRHRQDPLFIPAKASLLKLLGVFEKHRHNIGIVVNEYGETIGLVSTTDLLTEIAGEEYHDIPETHSHSIHTADSEGNIIANGGAQIREINRRFNLSLPLEGPKTLNGLVHDQLEDLPEAPCCIEIANVRMELIPAEKDSPLIIRILRSSLQ